MAETILYLFPESFNSNLFIEEISNDYLLKTEFLNKRRQIYFDTFDWRLYNHNLILFKEQKSYYLESLNSNQIITNYKSVNRSEFRFWWELSESDLKSKIKPVLDIRALLRLVDLDRDTVTLRILNTDKKTVLKVNVETIQTIKNKKPVSLNNLIRLQPIRGYQDDYNNFIQYLARKNWQKFTDHFFNYIMSIIGEVPALSNAELEC